MRSASKTDSLKEFLRSMIENDSLIIVLKAISGEYSHRRYLSFKTACSFSPEYTGIQWEKGPSSRTAILHGNPNDYNVPGTQRPV